MDRRTKKPTTKKKPPSKKAMQIKKDAERAKAAADPFATPGSARATLAAHRNKVKKDKSVKNKVCKEATVAYFHGTNAHFKHALIEGLGVGKVAAVFSVGVSRADIDGVRDDEGNKYEFTTRNGSYTKATALWQTDGSDGVGSKVELDRYADFLIWRNAPRGSAWKNLRKKSRRAASSRRAEEIVRGFRSGSTYEPTRRGPCTPRYW